MIPPIAVRLRRDFTQVLALIRAHAVLHRATRERDPDGQVIATLDDYDVVRALVSDVMSEGLGSSVSPATREVVRAVQSLLAEMEDASVGVKLKPVADMLELERSAASRRVQVARDGGYIENLESKKGKPMRLVLGDPLPDKVDVFPTVEVLAEAMGVQRESRGVQILLHSTFQSYSRIAM